MRDHGDPNFYTRNLIFTGNTLRSYEGVLKTFVEMAQREFGARRLEDIGKREFRAFMDRAIEQRLSPSTLDRYRSALCKFGCVTGRSRSFISLSEKYGGRIRELPPPSPPATPTADVAHRAVAILRDWDARQFERTGELRAYHLAAELQLETSCRSVSATARVTVESLRPGNQIVAIAKGGKALTFTISPDLHRRLSLYLAAKPGPLASQRAYQSAYARAVRAAGGHATGTHGLRRLSIRDFYGREYRAAVGSGISPGQAADAAAGNAMERLGHSRNRADHRRTYLGR